LQVVEIDSIGIEVVDSRQETALWRSYVLGRTAWPRTSLREYIQTIAVLLTNGFVGFPV